MQPYIAKIILFLLLIINTTHASPYEEKPIVVLITSYNNAQWYKKNLNSVFKQNYSNYRVVYVDDVSPDGTADLVEAHVRSLGQEHRFHLVRNQERLLALANIYYSVHECEDNEIIVSLDGDDWFPDELVLSKVNNVYSKKNVWLTHGRFKEYPTGHNDGRTPIPQHIIARNAFREHCCPTHLRTFYAWLFKKIKFDDLLFNGKFFEMTWDLAMLYPMVEMAAERHAFINDVLYIYNVSTPLNDYKVNPDLQKFYHKYICKMMQPYSRLEDSEVPAFAK